MNEVDAAFDGSTINLTLTLSPDTIVGQRYLGGGGGPEDGPAEYEPISLLDAIVERVACILVEQRDWSTQNVKQRVAERADAKLVELLEPVLDSILNEPLPVTNSYGEPTKQTFTLRERIVAIASKQLTLQGDGTRDYDKNIATKWVSGAVQTAIQKDLAAEFQIVRTAIKQKAAEAATAGMQAEIKKALGI